MNNNCVYFVEGECEKKFISALKEKPELILPGKVTVHNVVSNFIPKSRLLSISPETIVVFVFDTDVQKTDVLKKNIEYIEKYCKRSKLVFLPQVVNLEDELVRCTNVSTIKEITKSKSISNFKSDFCQLTNARSTLSRHQLDILALWNTKPPEAFTFISLNSNSIKK